MLNRKLKKCRPLFLITLFLLPVIIMWFLGVGIEWIGISVAWLIGIGAIMQSQISRWFFMPLFDIAIKEVPTKTVTALPQKYYSLIIKNCGFSPAKNVRVKIRDGANKSWISLQRPFTSLLNIHDKKKIYVDNLSVGEEEDFNIGVIGPGNIFTLMEDIRPTNQKTKININEKHDYFLEIVTDNANSYSLKIQIKNEGYEQFNDSSIQILSD